MPEIQEIDVHIDAFGRVRIEVRGVNGAKCEALTRELEQMLGGNVTERAYQDGYYAETDDMTDAERQTSET